MDNDRGAIATLAIGLGGWVVSRSYADTARVKLAPLGTTRLAGTGHEQQRER